MARSSIDQDNWSVAVLFALRKMLFDEVLNSERFTAISVGDWIVKTALDCGAIIEKAEIGLARLQNSLLFETMDIGVKRLFQLGWVENAEFGRIHRVWEVGADSKKRPHQ